MNNLAGIIAVCIFVSGCAHTPPNDSTEQSRLESAIRRIGEPDLSAGTIYVAGAKDRLNALLDFVSLRIVSQQVGGFESNVQVRNPPNVDLGSFLLGDPEGICDPNRDSSRFLPKVFCDKKSPVQLSIRPSKVARTQLTDSLTLLEILNRPLSGLNYNQSAELRITQWRTTLASASDSAKLFLCTSLATMLEGQLIIRGNLTQDAARSIATSLNHDRVMTMDFDHMTADTSSGMHEFLIPIAGPVQIEAVLSRLVFEESGAYPKLIFSIAGNRILTLQK